MKQIPPYCVWIGSMGDLQDSRPLYDAGIRAIVQLAYEEVPAALPRDFIVCRFPLFDGSDNDPQLIRLAVSTLTHLLEQRFATLVCCQAGQSRSPVIVAAALSRINGAPLASNVHELGRHHACSIHPALFAQVQSLATES